MPNYNKVIMIGYLTRDPQLSYTPNQTAVADFGIAVNHKWKSQDGEREDVCFIDCQSFGKRAETINKWCDKGMPLLIEGRLKFDQWTAQDGSKRSKHKIIVDTFAFVGEQKGKDSDEIDESKNSNAKPKQDGDIPF